MKEATLYKNLDDGRIMCTACARFCSLSQSQIGLCGIRQNLEGKLYLLTYGLVGSAHVDPIEKKPVTHYRPGTRIFSIGTTGCNWLCQYCQNYDLSQRRKVEGIPLTPEQVVERAQAYGCQGIAYTYNEPEIFMEFARDVGLIAREKGLFNIFVSNGFGTSDGVKVMKEFLDCITVDFKGSGEPEFIRRYIGIPSPEPIYKTLLDLATSGIHIEITDLVVPEIGDNIEAARKLSLWVYDNLGPETPTHFLRFHPDYKLQYLPLTPEKTLEEHHAVAKEIGLKYVYIGNVPGHPLEHTYCPNCNQIAVERYGFDIAGWKLDEQNNCRHCGHKINIVGRPPAKAQSPRFQSVRL